GSLPIPATPWHNGTAHAPLSARQQPATPSNPNPAPTPEHHHPFQRFLHIATTTTPVQLMIQEPAAEAELDKHMALFHNFPCEICGEKFSSFEGLTSHKISHLTPCPICEVRFKETTSLLSHFIQSHEGKELCNVCFGEVFESKEALAVHLEG
ncbi:Zinc finger and BTB domaincontaining protein 48like, partial [Caligus rogercresseyi]